MTQISCFKYTLYGYSLSFLEQNNPAAFFASSIFLHQPLLLLSRQFRFLQRINFRSVLLWYRLELKETTRTIYKKIPRIPFHTKSSTLNYITSFIHVNPHTFQDYRERRNKIINRNTHFTLLTYCIYVLYLTWTLLDIAAIHVPIFLWLSCHFDQPGGTLGVWRP